MACALAQVLLQASHTVFDHSCVRVEHNVGVRRSQELIVDAVDLPRVYEQHIMQAQLEVNVRGLVQLDGRAYCVELELAQAFSLEIVAADCWVLISGS